MAFSPSRSIPMNAFMLYMSGNSVQIFSIMVTVMLLYNSLVSVISCIDGMTFTNPVFLQYRNPDEPNAVSLVDRIKLLSKEQLLLPTLAFVGIQLANFALGVWKCNSMGLLPTASSDWLAFLPPKQVLERAVGGSIYSFNT